MVGLVAETVRYTYRLRPGRTAQRALLKEWGRCRWLWNEAVHQQKTRREPTRCKLSKMLTGARGLNAWLREGSQVAQQQTLRTYMAALDSSFKVKDRGRPKVKKLKSALPGLEYTTRGFRIRDGRLCLPGKVTVPVIWSRDLPSDPTSVRVYRDNLGHWYASFVVKRAAVVPAETDGSAIGIAASKGYLRAKRQAARIEKKAARQNTHDARQWAARVVDAHHLIAVEDFKPKFLAKTTMARKAADAAIGACKRELIYRGTRAGRKVVLVPPAYTTMTCSECGVRANLRLGLGIRIFDCAACGYTADRDVNAARTILATAERVRASADDIRHSIASLRDGGPDAVRAGNPPNLSMGKR